MKLYLDTSIISHIQAPHKPEAEAITHAFYRFVMEHPDEYELFISPVVEFEVSNCPEPKQSLMVALIESMPIVHLSENQSALDLAEFYVEKNVLARKHIRDLAHVAYATVSQCDFVISWNMKHLVNPQTIIQVNSVNRLHDYYNIFIATPLVIIGENYDV